MKIFSPKNEFEATKENVLKISNTINEKNNYGQNFKGLYCWCNKREFLYII